MSVNWDCAKCSAHTIAHKAAMVSGEFDYKVKEWDEYTDLREALIWALLVTKFPAKSGWEITEKNWEEVYRRLYMLERVNGCYRKYHMGKDQPVREVYFTPEEVHSMIGMSVNAGNLSTASFKTYLYNQWVEKADYDLKKFKEKENVSD